MSDIVERLRVFIRFEHPKNYETHIVWQAADEIERLRKELKSLVDWEEPLHRALRLSDGDFSYLEADFAKARAALGEGK